MNLQQRAIGKKSALIYIDKSFWIFLGFPLFLYQLKIVHLKWELNQTKNRNKNSPNILMNLSSLKNAKNKIAVDFIFSETNRDSVKIYLLKINNKNTRKKVKYFQS